MAHRTANLFSPSQRDFKDSSDGLAGWEVTSASGIIRRIDKTGFYPLYDPARGGALIGNSAVIINPAGGDVVIKSAWVSAEEDTYYLFSIYVDSADGDLSYTIGLESNSTSSDSGAVSLGTTTVDVDETYTGRLYYRVKSGPSDQFVRMTVSVSGQGASSFASTNIAYLYDPVVCEDSLSHRGGITARVYGSLPAFMILDDSNINDLVTTPQIAYPLHRYLESLCSYLDEIKNTADSFKYTRATETVDGVPIKSALTDPVAASAGYIPWLAMMTGSRLLVQGSGYTPWAAFDADADGTFEWSDFDLISPTLAGDSNATWSDIQNYSTDFFDSVSGFRDQIRTGFTGINSARKDTIISYVRTLIDSEFSDTETVVISTTKDSPYQVQILVNPAVDPDGGDAAGTLISDAVNNSIAAGSVSSKVLTVLASGEGTHNFSETFSNTHSNSAAGGFDDYGLSFISDTDGFSRHVVLNDSWSSSTSPELGGGIGTGHYSSGSKYYYGTTGNLTGGYVRTSSSELCNLGGNTAGFDIFVVVSDVTFPSASVDTGGSGGNTPADWLLREKRLLVSGLDAGGSDNDWAVYLVSGLTSDVDTSVRLLLVEGYASLSATNYAYSDPIDIGLLNRKGDIAFRISRSALSTGTGTVTFYAQSSLYDDWASHTIGGGSITPNSASAGTDAQIQILGDMSSAGSWANAKALSCAVASFRLYNSPVEFESIGVTSSAAHAYIDGGSTDTYAYYSYSNPTVFIDFTSQDPYTVAFNATTHTVTNSVGITTDLSTSVSNASSNALSLSTMRRLGGTDNVWYFGSSANSSNGNNELTATLSASTAYDVKPYFVTVSDGTITSSDVHTETTDVDGYLVLDVDTVYDGGSTTYLGKTLTKVEVFDSTDGSASGTRVAYFLPSTIGASATSGTDEDATSWSITRSFPSSAATAFIPAQIVDTECVHMYEGSPSLTNCPELEIYTDFSVVLKTRRFWTGTETTDVFDIFKIVNSDGYGLTVFYDGPKIKATFYDGTNTETVEWVESPTYGYWHDIVVRRSAGNNFSLVIDGEEVDTDTVAASVQFANPTNVCKFSTGTTNEFNARFALAEFGFFSRYLTDGEITLLDSEI